MAERQYCASCYVIDFLNKKSLFMYNKKLGKWLQPGGHIEGMELPQEAAVREVLEETGVKIKIIGPTYDGIVYQAIAVEHYLNKVGDMIDIQYLGMPISNEQIEYEENSIRWIPIDKLEEYNDVDTEIKVKVKSLYNKYKNKG